jgi:hypothetical protein
MIVESHRKKSRQEKRIVKQGTMVRDCDNWNISITSLDSLKEFVIVLIFNNSKRTTSIKIDPRSRDCEARSGE